MASASFKSPIVLDAWSNSSSYGAFAVGDINKDGLPDIIRGGSGRTLMVNYQGIDGSFENHALIPAFDQSMMYGSASDISIVDVNGDGFLDIVDSGTSEIGGASQYTANIIISYGDGAGSFIGSAHKIESFTGGTASFADLDGDGKLDIASVGIYSQVTLLITGPYAEYFSNGSGTGGFGVYHEGGELRNTGTISNSSYNNAGVFADINGDGVPDFVVTETSNQTIAIYEGVRREIQPGTIPHGGQVFRSGNLVASTRYSVGGWATDVETADLNHDGHADIVTLNVAADGVRKDDISIFLNDGSGNLKYRGISVPDIYGPGGGWQGSHSFKLGDINNDGNIDIVALGRTNVVWIFSGDGTGTFDRGVAIPVRSNVGNIDLADMNNDGLLDIILGNGVAEIYINTTGNNVLETQNTQIIKTVLEFSAYDRIVTYDRPDALNEQIVLKISDGGILDLSQKLEGNRGVTVYASDAGNTVIAGEKADKLYGAVGIDRLSGGGGDDFLEGGGGADTLLGGLGDDIYVTDGGDTITEAANAGIDTVQSSVTLALGANLENLTLTGNTSINGTGNALVNTIIGNGSANVLNGGAGADLLYGFGGNDTYYVDNAGDRVFEAVGGGNDSVGTSVSYALTAGQEIERLGTTSSAGTAAINLTGNEFAQVILGNAGNNALNGRGGADTMYGYAGNDIYYVDNAGDQVIEAANGGIDAVGASVSYVLAKGQSIETLGTTASAGTAAINLTGNELAQTIRGNAGANALKGGGGGDSLYGFGGDDTYYVYASSDKVFEAANQGNDTVAANAHFALAAGQSIEAMATFASAGTTSINLTGNEVGQSIRGNAGANVLNGKGGTDVLTGLGGADTFVFDTALGSGNVDRITDFATSISKVHDTIQLAKGIFTALAPGDLSAAAFKETSAGTVDANDRILYDKTTGALSYDSDGLGGAAAVQFATLDNKVALSHLDFFVV